MSLSAFAFSCLARASSRSMRCMASWTCGMSDLRLTVLMEMPSGFVDASEVAQKRPGQFIRQMMVVFRHERRPCRRECTQNNNLAQGEGREHQGKRDGCFGVGMCDLGALGEQRVYDATEIADLEFVHPFAE